MEMRALELFCTCPLSPTLHCSLIEEFAMKFSRELDGLP